MAKDLMGPAAFGALNPATTRPAITPENANGSLDTWFRDCTSLTARDGTALVAGQLNFFLAQFRRAIRGMGISESNIDDDMLLKAIQAASSGGALPAHTHVISEIINLQPALDGKAPISHNHDGAYVLKAGDTMTGTLIVPRVRTDAIDFRVSGVDKWTLYQDASLFRLHSYDGGGTRLAVNKFGALGLSGELYGTAGQIPVSQGSGSATIWQSISQLTPILRYDLVTASGASSWYPSAANAWVSVPLNTVLTNDIPSASASGGGITLPAGTYDFEGRLGMAAAPGTFWLLRLENVTDGLVIGQSVTGFANGYETQAEQLTSGRFTIAGSKSLALEVYASSASSGNWRNGTAASSTAQISSLKITKVG